MLQICAQKGIKQAIATNKRQDCANKICSHFGIDKFCNPIYGGDRYNTLSKSDLIKKCLDFYSIRDLSSAVMVGDTDSDRNSAQDVGINFIGVNYGFGFKNITSYSSSSKEILCKLGINND